MDLRSIEQCTPRMQHHGSTIVWWLQEAREMFAETVGGHLELVSEFEVAGGGAVQAHKHPTYEFYYVTSGRGHMTIEGETRVIQPCDLICIPPNAVHSLAPLTPHAPIHCFCFAVGVPNSRGSGSADQWQPRPMDLRSIRDVVPVMEHEGTTKVWWLYKPGELYDLTAGGHLELIDEFEVAGGGAVHPHCHPTTEFYYMTYGRGMMVIEGVSREIGPGDLVLIPPDAVHSIAPLSPNAPLRSFCFAMGVKDSAPYDYSYDQSQE